MTGWTRWAIALAVVALVVSATTPSFATSSSAATQWLSSEETAARRDALLKQMIARPNDLTSRSNMQISPPKPETKKARSRRSSGC